MLFMRKLEHGKDADELAQVAIALLAPYKALVKTVTTDNGGHYGLFHRSLFLMAERSHRECKRAHKAIYTQIIAYKTSQGQGY